MQGNPWIKTPVYRRQVRVFFAWRIWPSVSLWIYTWPFPNSVRTDADGNSNTRWYCLVGEKLPKERRLLQHHSKKRQKENLTNLRWSQMDFVVHMRYFRMVQNLFRKIKKNYQTIICVYKNTFVVNLGELHEKSCMLIKLMQFATYVIFQCFLGHLKVFLCVLKHYNTKTVGLYFKGLEQIMNRKVRYCFISFQVMRAASTTKTRIK